jgi:tetratricopeptide (TPR) repeat protein
MQSAPARAWLLLLAIGAAAYANSFRGVFYLDDFASIVDDARLDGLAAFLAHLAGMIRPLFKLSLLVDRQLWGENPAGYHAINVVLHLGSGLLVYAIVARLAQGRDDIAFWTAALFLAHPIATETVTYLSGRATGLMAFFYLAGLLAYLRGKTGAALACFVAALLSKEPAVTFPLALLLVEAVAHKRSGAELREVVLRRHVVFWLALAAFLAIAAANARYAELLTHSLGMRSVADNLLTQANVVAFALSLFVMPQHLNFDHDFAPYQALPTAMALVLLIGLLATAITQARRRPLLAFGILWFFLQILPTNSILAREDLLSERNLYLAAPGLFLAVVSLCASASRRLRLLPWAIVALLVVATVSRNALYADPLQLWSDAVRKSPDKARPHVSLGYALYDAGEYDRAVDELRRALTIDRGNPHAQEKLRAAWEAKAAMEPTAR